MRPPFAHPLRVRYADTDAQGHVYFANYLTYADEGLSGWLRHLGWGSDRCDAEDIDFVFADAQVSYKARAFFEDVLHVHVGAERVGRTSVVVRFEIVRAESGELLASGRLVQVLITLKTREKTPVPDALRQALVSESAG